MPKSARVLLGAILLMACHSAFASLSPSNDLTSSLSATQQVDTVSIVGATYKMQTTLKVTPVGFETEEGSILNDQGQTISLEKGDGFILMDRQVDQNGNVLLRIGTDFDEASDFWVSENDLPPGAAQIYFEETDPSYTPAMANDENAVDEAANSYLETNIARRGRHARPKRRKHGGGSYCTFHPKSLGCCYSAVKGKLLAMGLVRHRLAGVNASSAASQLRSGWKEVGCGHRSHPSLGMTCTYRGGPHGHVEVFASCGGGHHWYYGAHCGDYMKSRARRCFSCKIPSR